MALAFCYTQLARGQHDHRRDQRGAARREPRRLGHDAVARAAGGDRRDPLGDPRPGAVRQRRCARMAKKDKHVSETPATQWLRQHGVAFTEHVYDYVEHGGTAESARQLGVDEHAVVKTLVMQDERAAAADRADARRPQVSTKNLARAIGVQERRALHARGGAAPQRLPGRRHLAVRHAQGDAGVRRGQRAGAAAHLHQRRAARLPGRHRAGGADARCSAPSRCTARCASATSAPMRDTAALHAADSRCRAGRLPRSARCRSPSSSAARWAWPTRAPTARATPARPTCCARATRPRPC